MINNMTMSKDVFLNNKYTNCKLLHYIIILPLHIFIYIFIYTQKHSFVVTIPVHSVAIKNTFAGCVNLKEDRTSVIFAAV